MKLNSLKDLYISELRDLFSAENQIIEALPKMAEAATKPDLKSAFQEHLNVTKRQKERLQKVFELLKEKPEGETCEGMKGLIKEGEKFIKKEKSMFRSGIDDDVLDAALVTAAQRVEHYEMAAYGTVRTYADQLGFHQQADLLQQTLDEEAETDRKLTSLAESGINLEAE